MGKIPNKVTPHVNYFDAFFSYTKVNNKPGHCFLLDMFKNLHKRKFRIQITILISFFLVLIIACGSIIYYNFSKTSNAFLADVESDIQKAAESIVTNTKTSLQPAATMSLLLASVMKNQSSVLDQTSDIVPLSMQMLLNFPQLAAFYNGDAQGNVLSISRIMGGESYPFNKGKKLPSESAYEEHIIDRRKKPAIESYTYRDIWGTVVAREERIFPENGYDPRKRPWYQGAAKNKALYWTDPYTFSLSSDVGITAASPILTPEKKDVKIVTSADITMTDISKLVAKYKIGQFGISFIFDESGNLIGYPNLKKIKIKPKDAPITVLKVTDLQDPLVIHTYQAYQKNGKSSYLLEENGETYLATFVKIGQEFNKNWTIGFIVKRDEFLVMANEMTRTMMIFAVITLMISTILIYIVSRNIARPIEATAAELEAIGRFDIDNSNPIETRFFEIEQMNQALIKMKRSLQDFGKFVPKSIVRKLIETGAGAQLGGKKMTITILFSDIERFSTISELMPSEDMAMHLSEYFDELTQIIIEHNGTIDKYIGDSIMAFWGAPMEDSNHIQNACKALVQCQSKLKELNLRWEKDGKPKLPTRWGLHTGEAVVGNVGSKERLNYSAFGDSVNLASRLEGINKFYGTYTMITEDIYQHVRDDFICRPADIVAVYGKSKGVKIYELMMSKSSEDNDISDLYDMNRLADLTNQAFGFYKQQDFKKALSSYKQIHKEFPKDTIAPMYIKRCTEYIKAPPPKGWQGIYHMTSK